MAADVGVSQLLASAFSSSLNSTVVTYEQYEKEKDKKDACWEALDINQLFNLSHIVGYIGDRADDTLAGHSARKCGQDVCGSGMNELFVRTLMGRTTTVQMAATASTKELKEKLWDIEGIPIDQQRLLFGGMQLEDGRALLEYNIKNQATLNLVLRLCDGTGGFSKYYIDDKLLNPSFDYNFTDMTDDGTKFYRGGKPYHHPYGWERFALKVLGKYDDDKWLGAAGYRTNSSDGEWPVSYHGTGVNVTGNIAQEGYDLSKGKRFKYGKGIYSSPSIDIAALYTHNFKHDGQTYQLVFQNRVSAEDLKVINDPVGEYWLQPHQEKIRPYGVCLRSVAQSQDPDPKAWELPCTLL